MSSLNSVLYKEASARNVSDVVLDDGPIAIRLKYIGDGVVTSVIMTTANNITFISVDSDGTTQTDAYVFGTYTNMGLLADKINSDGRFEAKILDALRTDETGNSDFLSNTTITISADGYYDCLIDTSVAQNAGNDFIYTYRVTYDRGVNTGLVAGSHRVRLSEVLYNVDVNGIEAGGFQIFEWDATNKKETLIYQRASVDATNATINFASGNKTLDAGIGNDLIVRVKDTTSITDQTANFLNVNYTKE